MFNNENDQVPSQYPYKPLGLTAHGRRKQSETRSDVLEKSTVATRLKQLEPSFRRPRWVYIVGIHAIGLMLLVIVLHLTAVACPATDPRMPPIRERLPRAAFSLERGKTVSLSDNSSEEHRHNLVDSFARFHHKTFGIVRPRTLRKMPAFAVRCLWPWRRIGNNQTRWRPLQRRSQLLMLAEIS